MIYTEIDLVSNELPKWSKNATEFEVSVNYSDKRGYQTTIPKPIMKKSGESNRIKFSIKGSKVEVEKA